MHSNRFHTRKAIGLSLHVIGRRTRHSLMKKSGFGMPHLSGVLHFHGLSIEQNFVTRKFPYMQEQPLHERLATMKAFHHLSMMQPNLFQSDFAPWVPSSLRPSRHDGNTLDRHFQGGTDCLSVAVDSSHTSSSLAASIGTPSLDGRDTFHDERCVLCGSSAQERLHR